MKVGHKFTNDFGEKCEVIAVNGDICEVKTEFGETYELNIEYLNFVGKLAQQEVLD